MIPCLVSKTSRSGEGVLYNNNNVEHDQERKRAGTPNRVGWLAYDLIGTRDATSWRSLDRNTARQLLPRVVPRTCRGRQGRRKRRARTELLQACSCVRMNLKRRPEGWYHLKRDGWTRATISQVPASFQVPSLIKASQVPSRPGVAAPLPLELVRPNICCPLV